jgi:hypothetical protein
MRSDPSRKPRKPNLVVVRKHPVRKINALWITDEDKGSTGGSACPNRDGEAEPVVKPSNLYEIPRR